MTVSCNVLAGIITKLEADVFHALSSLYKRFLGGGAEKLEAHNKSSAVI